MYYKSYCFAVIFGLHTETYGFGGAHFLPPVDLRIVEKGKVSVCTKKRR